MSERDDINAVKEAGKISAESAPAAAGSEVNDNITIRQSTPADEVKAKPGFLNRLKKAFSTEDDPQTEPFGGEPPEEEGNLFGSLFGRLKKKPAESDAPAADNTDNSEGEAPVKAAQSEEAEKPAEIPEEAVKEEDPAEAEEFLMISAFLEGEEYTPEESAFDAHSALEDEEAVFEVDDENSDTADADASGVDDGEMTALTDPENGDDSAEEERKDAEQSGEVSFESAAENTAAAPADGEAPASGEGDNVAEASADGQKADSGESEAAGSGENGENSAQGGSDAPDAEGPAENEAAAAVEEQKEAEAGQSVQDTADVEPADSGDASGEGGEAPSKPEGDSGEAEKVTEELPDDDDEAFAPEEELLFDETDDELSDLASVDGMEDFGELTALFGEDDAESARAEKAPDTKEYAVEPLDSGDEAVHKTEPDDNIESNAENAEAKPEGGGKPEEKPDEKPQEGAQSAPEALPDEKAEGGETQSGASGDTASESTEDDKKTEGGEEKAGESSEEKPAADDGSAEKAAPEAEAGETTAHSGEGQAVSESASPSGSATEGKAAELKNKLTGIKGFFAKAGSSARNESEGGHEAGGAEAGAGGESEKPEGAKSFFARTKDKLIEMWNTKDDSAQPETAQAAGSDVLEEAEEDENDGWITAGDKLAVPEAPQEDGWVTGGISVSEKKDAAEKPKPRLVEEESRPETPPTPDEGSKAEKEGAGEAKEEAPAQPVQPAQPKAPVISVIKNDNAASSHIDEDKLRQSLNVIEKDVLTDEQKQALEANKKVLEKVEALEQETEQAREELRREAVRRESKAEVAAVTVTELDVGDYRPARGDFVKFAYGRFSESVKSEYDCIVNYKRMRSVSTKEALSEPVPAAAEPRRPAKETPLPDISQSSIPEFKEARDFERNHDKVDSICKKLDYQDERDPEPVEYRSEEDANDVRRHVTAVRRRESWTSGAALGITFAAFIFALFAGRFTVGKGADGVAALQRIYAAVNFLLYAAMLFCCKDILIGGLKPLRRFKASPDTGVAAAAAATALQSLLAIIFPASFLGQGQGVYTLIVMLTLTVCCAGRYLNADRISANFRFVSDTVQKYAGKFFPDQRMVAKLLSGTKNDKTELSFQKKTTFLKHFMRLSRAEDPGDKLASGFALPAMILSLLVALIAGIASKSFLDAWSVLCVMLCAGVPISSRALAAVPLHRLSKKALMNKSMIVGYSAVDTFSDSAAVMIDSKDLYPAGSIQMNDFKALDTFRWQDGLFAAAAVTIAAGGAMAGMFDTMIDKKSRENLPQAEGVMYEDGRGLIGWVNNERICVGNRSLMAAHGILTPTKEEEDEYRAGGGEPLYIAMSGSLVGVILVSYTANHRVSDVLKRMEASDMSMLVRTTDVNITAERIARDFGIGIKSIKVLEQKGSNVIRDEMVGKEKASPAFIATKGGVTSFGLAVSECIQTKRNISLSLAVEIVGALLKLLIVTAIVLFAGIHHIGAMQLFLFSIFWVAAVLCAPIAVQKFQGSI